MTTAAAFHLDYTRRSGATETELKEAITRLAFYAGCRRSSRPGHMWGH